MRNLPPSIIQLSRFMHYKLQFLYCVQSQSFTTNLLWYIQNDKTNAYTLEHKIILKMIAKWVSFFTNAVFEKLGKYQNLQKIHKKIHQIKFIADNGKKFVKIIKCVQKYL